MEQDHATTLVNLTPPIASSSTTRSSLSGRIPGTVGDSVKDAIEIATKAVGLDNPRLS
jgi:hypothetical protein